MSASTLVCLLPVRNGAGDLPGYLESVARFADAVVALDDGSTDETRDLLAASPLVKVVLANASREGFHDWDDALNRSRLLEAAAELEPAWLLSLDADERLDPVDGEALRRFVETDALPGLAFGFNVFRMWSATDYEPVGYTVYRLFAFEPGQRFPEQRLHFDPVPTSIPRSRWLRTTLRIQHLAGLTPARRAARLEKYREADPDQAFAYSYPDLTEAPRELRRWEPHPPGFPVLAGGPEAGTGEEAVALSAIVISRDDEERIARTVASVAGQESPWPFEVIVVTSGTDRTAEIVRREFPDVTLVELPGPALPGEARNAGLRVARGDYVSFPGSHVELPAGSLAARIRAHDLGYAMVTGTTLNGTRTRAGWASYFLDHASVLPGRPSTELDGPPAHCSYLRQALLEVGGFPEGLRAGEDTVVNQRLASLGYDALRAQDVTLIHHNRCPTRRRLVRHHFVRGRSWGRILVDRHRHRGGLLRANGVRSLFHAQVSRRVARTARQVEAWGGDELQVEYGRCRRLVRLGAVAHWLGTCYELARPGRARLFVLWGSPTLTLLVGEDALMRIDLVARRAKLVRLPAGLPLDELGIDVDARVSVARSGRLRLPAGVPGMPLRTPALRLGRRLALAWAALTIAREDVHVIAVDGPVDQAELARLLDTRSRHERIAAVAPERELARPRWRFLGREA